VIDWLNTPTGHLFTHGLLLLVLIGVFWQVWRYDVRVAKVDADNQQQWEELCRIVDWLHEFVETQYGPPPDEPTDELPVVRADEPDTVVSHPADLFARKAQLLSRYSHQGQHRA